MNVADKPNFVQILTGMALMYAKKLEPEEFTLWWNTMQDWELNAFSESARHLLKHSEFMPRPADFEKLRKKVTQQNGAEMWDSVRRYLMYQPNGYTLDPDTPRAIASAIRAIGGANALAMCDEDKLHFMQKRFCEHYDQFTDRDEARSDLPLIGEAAKMLTHPTRRLT